MSIQKHSEAIGLLGRRVSDATILMHEAIARKMGLSGTDHKYLNFIVDEGKMTAGRLAELSGLTTGAITGMIDRFEQKNLVTREFDKQDRRKILIVPNKKNIEQLYKTAHLDLKSQVEKLLTSFKADELVVIKKYLEGSINVMNDVTERLKRS